ncbi:MAG: hypothetical protein QXO70_03515 [Candidatus Pacearchaeota archaeon]
MAGVGDLYKTSSALGRNFKIEVATEDTPVVFGGNMDAAPLRSSIEIYNEGPADVYLYFLGSSRDAARKLMPDSFISYSITKDVIVIAYTLENVAVLKCTEI